MGYELSYLQNLFRAFKANVHEDNYPADIVDYIQRNKREIAGNEFEVFEVEEFIEFIKSN